MKQFKTDIFIFIGLAVICLVVLLLTAGQTTVDIQLHDTYYVVDKISMTVLIIGPLTFLIFLARGLTNRFKTKGPNIGLIIGLILVIVITCYVVRIQKGYLTEATKLTDEEFPTREQFMLDTKNRIQWTWGLLGIWAAGLLLLTLRTVKIWKESHSSE